MKTSELLNDPAPKDLFRGDLVTMAILWEEKQKRMCMDCEAADCEYKAEAVQRGHCPLEPEDIFEDERGETNA